MSLLGLHLSRVPLHFVDVNSVPGTLVTGNGIRVRWAAVFPSVCTVISQPLDVADLVCVHLHSENADDLGEYRHIS